MGFPFFTGSEENRGPLYDQDHVNHEGDRLPADVGPQGRKIVTVQPPAADFPSAAPLMVVRLGDRAIATIPGEMTVEMGRRTRAAVLAAIGPAGVKRVALAGYANEFMHYFTTPEEYDMQHYEGGSTLFGKYSSNLIKDDLATLAGDIAQRKAAPQPATFDPHNGLTANFTPYGSGAKSATAVAQPAAAHRLRRATFAWQGGTRGLDRPFDRHFVSIQRQGPNKRWLPVTDDLGLQILWRVDDNGRYSAEWQVPLAQRLGRYRFVVTANNYRLASKPFRVWASNALVVKPLAGGRVALSYPPVDALADLTSRPAHPDGGQVAGVRRRHGHVFTLPPGATVGKGAARDRYGNRNGAALTATASAR